MLYGVSEHVYYKKLTDLHKQIQTIVETLFTHSLKYSILKTSALYLINIICCTSKLFIALIIIVKIVYFFEKKIFRGRYTVLYLVIKFVLRRITGIQIVLILVMNFFYNTKRNVLLVLRITCFVYVAAYLFF